MDIRLTLALPRDEISVPVVRTLLKQSLQVLGVLQECIEDIELALTEACTNALEHSVDGAEYEVSAGVRGDQCVIEVVDRGPGFDAARRGHADADPTAEDGRGIQLMRSLVDTVEFSSARQGSRVHLEKTLRWHEGSVIQHWTQDLPPAQRSVWTDDPESQPSPLA